MSVREILFRGKRVDNGEWVQGAFIPDVRETMLGTFGLDGYIKPVGRTKEERMMVEVDRETVGQYTGLTDRNGKRIFEGDIVNVKTTAYRFNGHVVCWSDKNLRWIIFDGHNSEYGLTAEFEYEVVGNIHDDPELLERGRE